MTVKTSVKDMGEKANNTTDEYALAKKLVIIVLTDFICWVGTPNSTPWIWKICKVADTLFHIQGDELMYGYSIVRERVAIFKFWCKKQNFIPRKRSTNRPIAKMLAQHLIKIVSTSPVEST